MSSSFSFSLCQTFAGWKPIFVLARSVTNTQACSSMRRRLVSALFVYDEHSVTNPNGTWSAFSSVPKDIARHPINCSDSLSPLTIDADEQLRHRLLALEFGVPPLTFIFIAIENCWVLPPL